MGMDLQGERGKLLKKFPPLPLHPLSLFKNFWVMDIGNTHADSITRCFSMNSAFASARMLHLPVGEYCDKGNYKPDWD